MPSGRKGKNRQRSRRKHQKQLLERSRRSRDEQINSILRDTDVIAHLPGNTSLRQQSFSCSQTSDHLFDICDGVENDSVLPESFFGSPSKSLGISCFSTPKRTPGNIHFGMKKSKRSLSSPSSMYHNPLSSIENDFGYLDEKSRVVATPIKVNTLEPSIWMHFLNYAHNLLSVFPNFLAKVCAWFKLTFSSINYVNNNKSKHALIVSTSFVDSKTKRVVQANKLLNEDVLFEKLSEILSVVSRLEEKHDLLIARVQGLEQSVEQLKIKPAMAPIPVPPPPPPPPPPPQLLCPSSTPGEPLEKKTCRKSVLIEVTPRPSITLQDILSVQLRKTPAHKPAIEKTPQKNGTNGVRGPLVSVDMLRSVKLRSSQLRRRSIERPLQTPSAIFKVRSP